MLNNIEELRNAYAKGENFEYLLFWGHTPSKDGSINSSCLSQWLPCTFVENSVKALGRKVKNFNDEVWKSHRYNIVVQGNLLKFSQNTTLQDFLISTGTKILVEASPYDRIWGIGMGKDNEFAQNPSKWRGQNLLGFALMDVRDKIISKGWS